MTESEQKSILAFARKSIETAFEKTEPELELFPENIRNVKSGAFVTLHKQGNLRGCIGTFDESNPLSEVIFEMARAAAFEDPRFPDLGKDELDLIDLEISVLTPRERIESPADIEIGRDGLYVTMGWQSGVLLPQVATEYNWSVEEFLSHTCQKAGLHQDSWKPLDEKGRFHSKIKIERFAAEIFSEK